MGSSVAKGSSALSTPEGTQAFLDTLKTHGVKEIDTARAYVDGKSEELLGEVRASRQFAVSTKAPGFSAHSLQYDRILKNSELSHTALKQDKVDIYYIHGPDFATPLEEQCRAFGKLYSEGRFERFGVSNLSPTQVEEVYAICKREGYPLPTVYQGMYNPLSRGPEKDLFPTLRKLDIAFYAFSPAAGGLLAKPIEQILNPAEGTRFKEMPIFGSMYLKEPFLSKLKMMNELCAKEGISVMEATMRWFMHHSELGSKDGFILGASSKEQADGTLTACEKGPLPQAVADGWHEVWQAVIDSDAVLPSWPPEKLVRGM